MWCVWVCVNALFVNEWLVHVKLTGAEVLAMLWGYFGLFYTKLVHSNLSSALYNLTPLFPYLAPTFYLFHPSRSLPSLYPPIYILLQNFVFFLLSCSVLRLFPLSRAQWRISSFPLILLPISPCTGDKVGLNTMLSACLHCLSFVYIHAANVPVEHAWVGII